MTVERPLPLVDDILEGFKGVIGADFEAYRNHVYRVTHLCDAAGRFGPEDRQKIQIAASFHDIGIWTDRTLDYLPPSIKAAEAYLTDIGKEAWIGDIRAMIEMHHRIRSCSDYASPLVEAFRRADVADFSLGLFPMGLPGNLIAELKAEFPNSGFHMRLIRLGIAWFVRHPLDPLPMFRR